MMPPYVCRHCSQIIECDDQPEVRTPVERLNDIIAHVESWSPEGDPLLDDLRIVREAMGDGCGPTGRAA